MVEGKNDLMKCRKRENGREAYRTLSEKELAVRSAKDANRYATDVEWMRRREIITRCTECDKQMKQTSLYAHRKCCKGRDSKTTLMKILELSIAESPLVDSC